MNHNYVQVSLEIRGFDDMTHEDISTLLHLQPSRVYFKGKRTHGTFGAMMPMNRWLVKAYTEPIDLDFEEQMDALHALVAARFEEFVFLCNKYSCEVKCATTIYKGNGESSPSVHLEKHHRKLLDALDAEFDVDIYVFAAD